MNVVRRGVAAVVSLGLLAVGVQFAVQAEVAVAAGTPTEVRVVSGDTPRKRLEDRIFIAGETGFLHKYDFRGAPVLWTRYADGVTTEIPELQSVIPFYSAGGDVVTTRTEVPGRSESGELTVLDLATMAWQHLPLPDSDDDSYLGYYGGAMMVVTGEDKLSLRRFAADGTYTTTSVTGFPAGATSITSKYVGDETDTVLRLVVGGKVRYALLDLADATVTLLPVQEGAVYRVLLTADRIGFFGGQDSARFMRSYARSAPTGEPEVVPISGSVNSRDVALSGTHAIGAPYDSESLVSRVVDYSAGGATVIPLAEGDQSVVQGMSTVLLLGGSGPTDWAVRRLTPDQKLTRVLPLDEPLVNAGVSLSHGLVRHVQAESRRGTTKAPFLLFNHTLAAGTDEGPKLYSGPLTGALACEPNAACVRTVDGNSQGTAFLARGETAKTSRLTTQVYSDGSTRYVDLPSAPGKVVDASTNYVVVNGADPAKQYVIEPYTRKVTVAGSARAAALWFDTLWTSPKSGYVQAKNLVSGKTATAVKTGAPCTAAEVQAAGRYIYWSCGANGPAGVYDRTRKVSVSVPSGQSLLGDGYVVRHDSASGELLRLDLATGTSATVATFPRGILADDRGITWAVDKFGGDIAYVDAANVVHVVDPGVARSAPTAGIVDASYARFEPGDGWGVTYSLSRPVVAWTVTVTQVRTGQVVATRTGGPNRVTFSSEWDGYLPNKKKVSSGHYKYRTSVTATIGEKPVTIDSGTLVVEGGVPNFHSYEASGEPSFLGVKANGEGHWLLATAGKSLRDAGYTEDWYWGSRNDQVNAIVPFGDFNSDGINDLIHRSGTGTLRARLGIDQADSGGAKKVTIGKGWNRYNTILTSGDLTGDINADLLARDKKGKLWRYNGTGKKSFKARVGLAGNFKAYARVIGPGDINGDGRADLVVVTKSGTMSAASGTGKGTFGKLRKVSTGWNKYNVLIGAGDLNEDGRNDLLARDKAGVMWRYLGDGKGGFGAREKVGTGYKKYSHMF